MAAARNLLEWKFYLFSFFLLTIENPQLTSSLAADPLLRPSTDSFRRLVRDISSMGFAPDRVARIAEKLGADNKKVSVAFVSGCIFFYVFRFLFTDC